jgi:(2Fe-2S) ferredoxin
MKPQTILRSLAFGVCTWSILAPLSSLRAQTPPPTAVPSPAPAAPPPTAAQARPQRKTLSLQIPSGTVQSAVSQLLQAMEAAQVPEINIIYGQGAADLPVPEVKIRNVSAADVLRLIATSAGCETEPILSAQDATTVIGYKVTQSLPAARIESGSPGAGASARPFGMGQGQDPHTSAPTAGNYVSAFKRNLYAPGGEKSQGAGGSILSATPGKAARTAGGGTAVNVMGDGRIVSMGLNPQTPVVRVYPLGTITTTVKFPDIEATLQDVLKAESGVAESTKLALHEKTNVLVVTGPPQAQELVSQYVEALQKNQTAAENQSGSRNELTRETTELRIELQAQEREKARLNEQLAKTDAQLRDLMHEMERLKASKTQ